MGQIAGAGGGAVVGRRPLCSTGGCVAGSKAAVARCGWHEQQGGANKESRVATAGHVAVAGPGPRTPIAVCRRGVTIHHIPAHKHRPSDFVRPIRRTRVDVGGAGGVQAGGGKAQGQGHARGGAGE